MTGSQLGQLFSELKQRLPKKILYDLFVALDENDEQLFELLGNLAKKNYPEKF